MVKSLMNKLIKKARNRACLAAAIASIGFAGCKLPEPNPIISDPQNPPTDPSLPTLTLPDMNIIESGSYSIDLSQYKDSFGNQVTLESAIVPPLVLIESMNGNILKIKVSDSVSENTPYQINLKFRDNANGKENTSSQKGTIENLVDISGTLQDETQNNSSGIVKIFDASNNSKIIEVSTSNGNFSVQASSPEISNIKLQAAIQEGGAWKSYVRTINVTGNKDVSLTDKLRAVRFPNFSTPGQFHDFVRQINTYIGDSGAFIYEKVNKWDLNNLIGIEICRTNSDGSASFNDTQLNIIKDKITANDDVEKFVKGKSLDSITSIVNHSSSHEGISGYIVVIPDNNVSPGSTGVCYQNPLNSKIITNATIKILPGAIYSGSINPVISHEFGHAFIAPEGHGDGTVSSNYTIMYSSGNVLTKPGIADEKAGYVIYEDTYQAGEKVDNILGKSFSDGVTTY